MYISHSLRNVEAANYFDHNTTVTTSVKALGIVIRPITANGTSEPHSAVVAERVWTTLESADSGTELQNVLRHDNKYRLLYLYMYKHHAVSGHYWVHPTSHIKICIGPDYSNLALNTYMYMFIYNVGLGTVKYREVLHQRGSPRRITSQLCDCLLL